MLSVDRRDGSVELVPMLKDQRVAHKVDTLPFGDFSLLGNGPEGPVPVGIERKTIRDLVSSMATGRFAGHQLIGLLEHYEYVYLIVEGLWRGDRRDGILQIFIRGKWCALSQGKRRFMARDVYQFLNTLSVICGIHVIRTGGVPETVHALRGLVRWWDKPWDRHKSHAAAYEGPPPPRAFLRRPSIVCRVAAQFTGVGWDRALAISHRFPSVEDFFFASKEDLMEVPGIGKGIAESIIEERQP